VTVDRDGVIRQRGQVVTELVGHSAADAIGRSLNIVIPPVFGLCIGGASIGQ
jgi:hypothetical protein